MAEMSRSAYLSIVLLAGTAISQPALAQDVQAEPTGASESTPEIVITARLRSERAIDVPASVTALGSAELQRYSTTNLANLGSQVPQVQLTHSPIGTGIIATIRGIGSNNVGDEGIEQAVSFIIDGVSTSRGRIVRQALFDLDNVQVLKGPQSLYFGKNSPGGVIIMQSKGPTDTLEGYARAGYEFTAKEVIGEAAIGGPITENLGFRVAAYGSDMSGGYVRNVSQPILAANSQVAYDRINGINLPGATYKWGPEAKQYAGRLTLALDLGDFTATFKAVGAHYESVGDTSEVLQLSCPAGFPTGAMRDIGAAAFGLPIGTVTDPSGTCDPKKRRNSIGSFPTVIANGIPGARDGEPYNRANNYLASLNLNYKLSDITLTSITGFYRYTNSGVSNASYNTQELILAENNSRNTSWTQELRAVSAFDGPINFSLGAFYQHDNRTLRNFSNLVRARDAATGLFANGGGHSFARGEAYSAVAELTWKIVPQVELAGGARYTKETKRSLYANDFVQAGIVSALNFFLPVAPERLARFKASNVSPQVTLSWKPDRDTNIFIGYRTGFKSGGISMPGLLPPTAANPATLIFNNEKVKGYEGGVKVRAFDRKLSADFTIYHYVYRGLQVSAFDAITNLLRIQNAGGAQLDGVELDLNYSLSDEFSLRGSAAYNRARFINFKNAQCYGGQVAATGCVASQQDLSGRQLPRAPDWAGSVGASWDHPVGSDLKIGATVDARYSSSYNFTSTLAPAAHQGKYGLLDASLRLYRADRRWELSLIGRNLTDKLYGTFGTDRPLGIQPGSVTGVVGLPRTIQAQVTYNF